MKEDIAAVRLRYPTVLTSYTPPRTEYNGRYLHHYSKWLDTQFIASKILSCVSVSRSVFVTVV